MQKFSLDKHFCFRFGTIAFILLFIDGKGFADRKKAKLLSKEEIKKHLLDSMIIDEVVEFEDLNREAKEMQDPQKATEIIEWYEDIIKT